MSAVRGLIRPPGLIRLDKSHPLAGRVLGAFVFGVGPPRDLLGKWAVAEFNSTPTVAVGPVGPHGSFTAGGYAALGTASTFTGNLSVVAVAMRAVSASTTPSVPDTVRGLYSSAVTGGSTGLELNLGNGFGAGADIDKPRAVDNNTSSSPGAWVTGTKQTATNPFPTAITNNVWYGLGTTHSSISAGADLFMGMVADSATDYFHNGGISCIWVFSGILPDGTMADLTANPWQIVTTQSDFISRFAVNTTTTQAITGTGFADSDAFGTGVVTRGAVAVTGTGFADADAFGTGVVTRGAVAITGSGFADADAFGTGIVSAVGVQGITGAGFADGDAFGEGSISGIQGRHGRWLRGRYTVVGDPEPDGPIVPDVRDITAEVVRSEARAVAAEMRAARARKDAAEVAALRQDLREMRALLRQIEDEEDEAAALLLALL